MTPIPAGHHSAFFSPSRQPLAPAASLCRRLADSSQPPAGAAALKPGRFLTHEQTLDEHPLPSAVATIDGCKDWNA